jgi:CysZ protein
MIVSAAVPEAAAVDRPGTIRRFAAGAWHVPGGFVFLVRKPRLWPLAALPALLAATLLGAGLLGGAFAIASIQDSLAGSLGGGLLQAVVLLALWVVSPLAGALLGLGIALLLTAPVLDALSRRVEALARGEAVDRTVGLRWEMAQSLKAAAYFLAAAPGVFIIGLIPVLGPPLAALWAAHALAFQQTDAALARHGLDFRSRRLWHRRWRAESLGFGLAALVALLLPLANLLLAPALVVGATRLVLELTPEDMASVTRDTTETG